MCMQKTSRRKCFSLGDICNSAAWQWAVPATIGRVPHKTNSACSHAAGFCTRDPQGCVSHYTAFPTVHAVIYLASCILSLNLQVTILTPVHL